MTGINKLHIWLCCKRKFSTGRFQHEIVPENTYVSFTDIYKLYIKPNPMVTILISVGTHDVSGNAYELAIL